MKNSIKAAVFFSFKGENLSPSTHIDLDELLSKGENLKLIHSMIARGEIDPYSYAYEVMQMNEVNYSQATGAAEKYLNNGNFDFEAFKQDWLNQRNLKIVENIAQDYMNIDQLDQHPELQNALMAALNHKSDTIIT